MGRIDPLALLEHLVVQVWCHRCAGGAHEADDLTPLHALALAHQDLGHVRVQGS